MQTITNTIEKLKAVLTVLALDNKLNYQNENGIEKGIENAINEAIDTLTLLNKPAQFYVPHLNEFIEDKSYYIWYNGERTTETFSVAMTNWTEDFAKDALDMLIIEKSLHKLNHKCEGASLENDDLIAEAAELVLSKYEYISNTTVN